jgi:hypothetical protein
MGPKGPVGEKGVRRGADRVAGPVSAIFACLQVREGETIMSSDGEPVGGGGFFGRMGEQLGPGGPHGLWPGCGCSSVLIILGGMLLVCGGFMSFFEGMFRR